MVAPLRLTQPSTQSSSCRALKNGVSPSLELCKPLCNLLPSFGLVDESSILLFFFLDAKLEAAINSFVNLSLIIKIRPCPSIISYDCIIISCSSSMTTTNRSSGGSNTGSKCWLILSLLLLLLWPSYASFHDRL